MLNNSVKKMLTILLSLGIFSTAFAELGVGDDCFDEISFSIATCVKMENCIHLQSITSADKNYTTCGFSNSSEIVCCPPVEDSEHPTPITTTAKTPTVSTSRRLQPRISELKCSEYAKSVYVTAYIYKGFENKAVTVDLCSHIVTPVIVGGYSARAKEFPHMAQLGFGQGESKEWKCGGTLISDEYVLTAAHCLVSQYGELRRVRLGEYNQVVSNRHSEEFGVSKTILHPNYDITSPYNDIALVLLDRKVKFNAYKRPACLAREFDRTETLAIATGWGSTSFSGQSPDILQKVILNIFTDDECRNAFPMGPDLPNGFNSIQQLCAGSYTESKDTCQGDSGGPLQLYRKTDYCMYTVIGVTSFGGACGEIGNPGVYQRVYGYLDWIESIVWPS